MKNKITLNQKVEIDVDEFFNQLQMMFGKPSRYSTIDTKNKQFIYEYDGYGGQEHKDIIQMTDKQFEAICLIGKLRELYKQLT